MKGNVLHSMVVGLTELAIVLQPVLMVGNISACLSILALGVAPNYKVAILSRFIGGLFTSSTGV